MLEITQAKTKEDIGCVRDLFKEYALSLPFDLCFQHFERELEDLPGEYAAPGGFLLLARCGGKPAGCVALRRCGSGICELKRLYVRPEYRGRKIGRRLTEKTIEAAIGLSYVSMRLDTVAGMKEAVSLYRSLGFKEIEPYRYNPIDSALFMELDLEAM